MKPKVLVIVEHGLYSPWKEILLNGQIPTWANSNKHVDVVHGHGRPIFKAGHEIDQFLYSIRLHRLRWLANTFVRFERLWKSPLNLGKWSPGVREKSIPNTGAPAWEVQMPDLAILQAHKTLSLLVHALNYDYDYVVTTTSGSYIDLEKLYEKILQLPRSNLISGRFVSMPGGGFFPSGAFRIFSIDVLQNVKSLRTSCNHWIPEDVAIGRLLDDPSYVFLEMPSLDLPTIEDIDRYSRSDLNGIAHFRCKSGSLRARGDVDIMLALHRRLAND
jgi:hypothetical protein